jgi:hypothetical protein
LSGICCLLNLSKLECLCIDIRLQSIGGSNGGDILGFLGVAERAGDDRGLGGRRSWLGGVRLFAQRTRFGGTQVGHDFNSHQVVHEWLDCCGRLLCRRRVRRLITGSGIGCWALSLFEVLSFGVLDERLNKTVLLNICSLCNLEFQFSNLLLSGLNLLFLSDQLIL